MSDVFTGRITHLAIGINVGTATQIDNVVLMNWELNHDVRPRLFANLKAPTTYQQPHSWIIGSVSVLSDQHTAFYATDVQAVGGNQFALVPGADSNVIDYFVVTYEDEAGNAQTTTFDSAIIYRYTKELLNFDDSVWIYHFLAGFATDA